MEAASSDQDSSLQQQKKSPESGILVRCLPLKCFDSVLSNSIPYMRGGLASAILLCPFVVGVKLTHYSRSFDYELKALLSLEELRYLALEDVNVSFYGAILPILQKFGTKSLEKLKLFDMGEVDVAAIVKHCSNLRSLTLSDGHYIQSPQSSPTQYQLLKLESLDFCQSRSSSEPPTLADLSILLLSAPSLVKLRLQGFDEQLTDQLIKRVVQHHGFPELGKLELQNCDEITKNSIDLLLSLNSPISKLELSKCEQLNQEDVDNWKKMAKKNNWDLKISCK